MRASGRGRWEDEETRVALVEGCERGRCELRGSVWVLCVRE